MPVRQPILSVVMVTYNHEAYIAQAIEGILNQTFEAPFELIIGEDCSTDSTRGICENYAAKHPDVIRLLPSVKNLGRARNSLRAFCSARGKYVAICDGDDFWTDPFKLRDQFNFLEQHPEYGLVYTDVSLISNDGLDIEEHEIAVGLLYKQGAVFFDLLQGNFINNCTTLFRRELVILDQKNLHKYWYWMDYFRWLIISFQTKVKFIDRKTACYRVHQKGVTRSSNFLKNVRRRGYYILHDALMNFDQYNQNSLSHSEKQLIYKKMLSLLYRRYGTLKMKYQIFQRIWKYYPGLAPVGNIFWKKVQQYSEQ